MICEVKVFTLTTASRSPGDARPPPVDARWTPVAVRSAPVDVRHAPVSVRRRPINESVDLGRARFVLLGERQVRTPARRSPVDAGSIPAVGDVRLTPASVQFSSVISWIDANFSGPRFRRRGISPIVFADDADPAAALHRSHLKAFPRGCRAGPSAKSDPGRSRAPMKRTGTTLRFADAFK